MPYPMVGGLTKDALERIQEHMIKHNKNFTAMMAKHPHLASLKAFKFNATHPIYPAAVATTSKTPFNMTIMVVFIAIVVMLLVCAVVGVMVSSDNSKKGPRALAP